MLAPSSSVSCVRLGYAYRVGVEHQASGVTINELSTARPTEHEARATAPGICRLFARGTTVHQVLDALNNARSTANLAA